LPLDGIGFERLSQEITTSSTCFARNQDNFFILNDLQAKEKYGKEVELVLVKSNDDYNKSGHELVVKTPRLSRKGLVLIRTIVMDTVNPKHLEETAKIQRLAYAEQVQENRNKDKTPSQARYKCVFSTPRLGYTQIYYSLDEIEKNVRDDFNQSISLAKPLSEKTVIELDGTSLVIHKEEVP